MTSSFVRRPGRTGPVTVRHGATSPPGRQACRRMRGLGGSRRGHRSESRSAAVAAIAAEGNARRAQALRCVRQAARRRSRAWRARRVVGVGAEHADQLGDDLALGELEDRRARRLGGGVLDDREVTVAERGDLGQVGDAQHLPAAAELAQALADRARGMAADAGVDLVEHERRIQRTTRWRRS